MISTFAIAGFCVNRVTAFAKARANHVSRHSFPLECNATMTQKHSITGEVSVRK